MSSKYPCNIEGENTYKEDNLMSINKSLSTSASRRILINESSIPMYEGNSKSSKHRLINAINNHSLKRQYLYSTYIPSQNNEDFEKITHNAINERSINSPKLTRVESSFGLHKVSNPNTQIVAHKRKLY
mmetsp:Transcript_1981/g.1791  ORF Transcript_1981/g.1791 Transcript_1981/m.1791 type:complete len:129 (+) Transcript_1981:181-567(+)